MAVAVTAVETRSRGARSEQEVPAPPRAARERNAASGEAPVSQSLENGSHAVIDGKECIHYDGYWIRYYKPPRDTLSAKKVLIDHLKRRVFHHTEPGINTPGERLDRARRAWARERDPARRRVNGAMLAGALLNRAADIFTTVVELEQKGVRISPENELMRQCGEYFREALELGRTVRHYSGEEGIDELWGEPLKAFTMSIEAFYESRYVKIAQTMRDIDRVSQCMQETFAPDQPFEGLAPRIGEFADAAKQVSETIRSDLVIFEVWPLFVAAGERLLAFRPGVPERSTEADRRRLREGVRLVRDGKDLLTWLAGARVPMAKSTSEYLDKCGDFARGGVAARSRATG